VDAFVSSVLATVALCSRSSARFSAATDKGSAETAAAEALWFGALDFLVERQRRLKIRSAAAADLVAANNAKLALSPPARRAKENEATVIDGLPQSQTPAVAQALQQMSADVGTPEGAARLKAVAVATLLSLSEAVRTVLEAMRAVVPLGKVLNKVLNDHSKAEFGEFRETIQGMMSTYAVRGCYFNVAIVPRLSSFICSMSNVYSTRPTS
jgi:chemotaxis response regulator CheB